LPEAMSQSPMSLPEGAEELPMAGFNQEIGPFYRLPNDGDGDAKRFAFVVAERHMNAAGSVHGGMLMAFTDMAMSQTARAGTPATGSNTITLNCDFVGPARLHDVIEARARVTRRARTVVFLSAELFANDRLILVANGLWKVIGAP